MNTTSTALKGNKANLGTKSKGNGTDLKNYIGQKVDNFLNDKKARSVNTYKNYKIDIEQFFQFFFDKEYKFVTMEELESLTADDMIKYRNKLIESGKVHSTVNRKIVSVKKLFTYMEATNKQIRSAIFNVVEKLKENDTKSYGVLTWEEGQEMMQRALRLKDGDRFSLLIEVAIKTCYRLDALLELTPNHIHLVSQKGQEFHVIRIIDKGEKHEKSISESLYNKMMQFVSSQDEKFFTWSKHTVGRRFQSLVEEMKLDVRRNIKFHSLKKCGINFVFDSTGNVMLAQKQGNHKSPTTTMKSYLEHNVDYAKMPSYTMGDKIDLEPLNELTKEQLMELIGQAGSGTQLELLRLLNN
jgi:site-specific recombinase XerD